MLRHIISVSLASLAMTACASLIPIKANAARLILIPMQDLDIKVIQRNPGESIGFVLLLDEIHFREQIEIQSYGVDYDRTELSLVQTLDPIGLNQELRGTAVLARYIFEVLEGVVKDGLPDVSAGASYRLQTGYFSPPSFEGAVTVSGDVEPVPEPVTIFGTATALGCGALFKRKSSKKKVS